MITVTVATIVAFFFYNQVIHFINRRYRQFLASHPSKDIANANLVVTGPLEGLSTRLQVSAYVNL